MENQAPPAGVQMTAPPQGQVGYGLAPNESPRPLDPAGVTNVTIVQQVVAPEMEKYCGTNTWLAGCVLCWCIGPFALIFCCLPIDERPKGSKAVV